MAPVQEAFMSADSLIRRLDPRAKIVEAVFLSVVVAVLHKTAALAAALALGLCIVTIGGVPIKKLARRLAPVNMFVLFLWIFLPFSVQGQPLFSIGPLAGTHEGVLYAAQITIKSNAILLVLAALVASTPLFTLGHAMRELGFPGKIVHLFFFTYRYIHVIFEEYLRMMNALKVRGFTPGTNMHTYRTFAYVAGMLLVRSCDRAERIHKAMVCRGFTGELYSLATFSLGTNDVVSLILAAAACLSLGLMEWTSIM